MKIAHQVGPKRRRFLNTRCLATVFVAMALATAGAHAAERVTLTNGFSITCDHMSSLKASTASKVRLYMDSGSDNFVEVDPARIATTESVSSPVAAIVSPTSQTSPDKLTSADLRQMLARAGAEHNLNADLLASVVREESDGHAHAVSRAGAEGLMQLMPGTAAQLGVSDAFAPGENIQGGTAYLDSLLHRYHDNLALALAAYNAGPAAVDKWHGIPPYRETRLYVARVIHEFNRRVASRSTHAFTQVAGAAR